ncbi:MAG TPA: trypsin-like serine protease [Streptosporangiaceae bacterium]
MPRRAARAGTWAAGLLAIAVLPVAASAPAPHGAARIALRMASAMNSIPRKAAPAPPVRAAGEPFGGTPAVGALFSTTRSGGLGTHFCTASVVHSPHHDVLITAAHCLARHSGRIDFVPGYSAGRAPYGIWTVTRVVADHAWLTSASQDDDVAFAVVSQPRTGLRIEDVTGAEQLRIGALGHLPVQVIGYPDGAGQPITCQGRTSVPMSRQLEFDCRKYTGGTSGGPFLLNVDPATGDGSVIGVIGGYEQGGDLPQISYAAAFGANIAALYQTAIRQS